MKNINIHLPPAKALVTAPAPRGKKELKGERCDERQFPKSTYCKTNTVYLHFNMISFS